MISCRASVSSIALIASLVSALVTRSNVVAVASGGTSFTETVNYWTND